LIIQMASGVLGVDPLVEGLLSRPGAGGLATGDIPARHFPKATIRQLHPIADAVTRLGQGVVAAQPGPSAASAATARVGANAGKVKSTVAAAAAPVGLATGSKARQILGRALGKSPFPVESQAHHIFPVSQFDTPLGKKLQAWGIDLNGAANGVWLPKVDYPGRVASLHRGGNSAAYNNEVIERLDVAKTKEVAEALLNKIRQDLLAGRLAINGAE
jgi:hypothetical protein